MTDLSPKPKIDCKSVALLKLRDLLREFSKREHLLMSTENKISQRREKPNADFKSANSSRVERQREDSKKGKTMRKEKMKEDSNRRDTMRGKQLSSKNMQLTKKSQINLLQSLSEKRSPIMIGKLSTKKPLKKSEIKEILSTNRIEWRSKGKDSCRRKENSLSSGKELRGIRE